MRKGITLYIRNAKNGGVARGYCRGCPRHCWTEWAGRIRQIAGYGCVSTSLGLGKSWQKQRAQDCMDCRSTQYHTSLGWKSCIDRY